MQELHIHLQGAACYLRAEMCCAATLPDLLLCAAALLWCAAGLSGLSCTALLYCAALLPCSISLCAAAALLS